MIWCDTHRPRFAWWWWTTLVCGVLLLILIVLSFTWIIAWIDPGAHYYVYFEHGMLVGNPNVGVSSRGTMPWYGYFEVYKSSVYEPWALFPEFYPEIGFKVPAHLVALVIVPILVYPFMSPFLRRQYRRRKGLCLTCGYNLTGNVSGTCPECGEPT